MPPQGPRDTLDDLDRQADFVHERTDPIDPLREAPTDVQEARTDPLGSRELPTGDAEQRTAPWMHAAPWADPESGVPAKRDPWFWPVFLFVAVLATCIGVFVYQELHKVH